MAEPKKIADSLPLLTFKLRLDWALLRAQKAWLELQSCPEAEGVLGVLDALQDAAAEQGVSPATIWGEEFAAGM